MLGRLVAWLRELWRQLRRRSTYAGVRRVASMDEVPEVLGSVIYLVVRGGSPRWVVMSCPCRCGARIEVNLMKSQHPYWQITEEANTITLRPSLWRSHGTCESHFFVDRNNIRWV